MNFLILGDGAEEHAWARALAGHAAHRVAAALPGFDDLPTVPEPKDLDDALATVGIEAVIVGGGPEFRAEALRRVAAVGLPAICLHPPGPDSEAYYQVALSRAETGAVIVPDLPARLHPGVEALREALNREELGSFRALRHESPAGLEGVDLARYALPRVIDVVRSVIGEVESLTATGDPPGASPTGELIVQLRGPQGRRAEVRVWSGPDLPSRLVALGTLATLTLEYDPTFHDPARLVHHASDGQESVTALLPWDRHEAMLGVLADAIAQGKAHPNLHDGTRATEVGEAVVRSLRRGRTVDLHYEEISEAGAFKSVMTSFGCMLLLGALVALPAAMIGPALGMAWTLYVAYAIPPALILFILAQSLSLAIRGEKTRPQSDKEHKDIHKDVKIRN